MVTKNWIISENVSWNVAPDGIMLYDNLRLVSKFIEYPEAIVWDLMAQDFNTGIICHLTSKMIKLDETSTRKYVEECFDSWYANGFIK